MALPLRRSGADDLSAAFARAIRAGSRSDVPIVGVEHEFRVLHGSRTVDFRRLIHDLPIPGRRLDPADPNAYRGAWGGSITSDGLEAELAIPPHAVEGGFAARAAATAMRGRGEIRRALPADLRLEGYSTHISVSMPDRVVEEAARQFASRFGPALLMLMDGPASPGLLVRPRPGRLELGAEFVDGERLQASLIFAAGAALAVARAVGSRLPWFSHLLANRRLPAALDVELEPATDRYGWFVGGTVAAGLHANGRRARLRVAGRTRGARTVTGQEHLEAAWAVARRSLLGVVGDEELALVDRFVRGGAQLGVELDQAAAIAFDGVGVIGRDASAPPSAMALDVDGGGPFGSAIRVRRRPGLLIEPAMVGWDFVVLRVTEDLATVTGRTAFACLPRAVLGEGLEAIDRGHLDAILRAYLNLNADPRVLAGAPQTRRPGLFRTAAAGGKLLARELGPDLPGSERPGKRERPRDSQDPPGDQPPGQPSVPAGAAPAAAAAAAAFTIFGLPAAAAAAIAGVAAVAVIGGAIMIGGGPRSTPGPGASATAANTSGPTGPVGGLGSALFGIGSADISITTDSGESGAVTVPFLHGRIDDGLLNITWGDGTYFPATGGTDSTEWVAMYGRVAADGSFLTDTNEVRFGAYLESGDQLAINPGADHCLVEMRRTPTSGIAGTFSCAEIDEFFGPYQVEGTFWAEPGDGGTSPTSGPPGSEPPRYTTGGASLTFGGEASGGAELMFDSEAGAGDGDGGPIYPTLVFQSVDGSNYLEIVMPILRPDGTFDTLTNEVGLYWGIEGVDIGGGPPESYPNGLGLLHGSESDSEIFCLITFSPTLTQGVTGTIECPNVNHPTLVITLDGTFWAEPAGGAVGPDPDPGTGPDYNVGTASMRLSGEGEGSAEMGFSDEYLASSDGGPTYPVLVWSDAEALSVLGIYTLEPHALGVLSTADGTLGVGFAFKESAIGGFPDDFGYNNGLGLGHGFGEGFGTCTATIVATPTGGISGTLSCSDLNDPSLPVGLTAEFTAEHDPTAPGDDGGGVIITP